MRSKWIAMVFRSRLRRFYSTTLAEVLKMALDLSRLQRARQRSGKTVAQCPACAESGADKKGEHLVVFEDGRFGCIIFQGGDATAVEHRKRIHELAGALQPPQSVGRNACALSPHRLTAAAEAAPPPLPADFDRITRDARAALYSCRLKQEAVAREFGISPATVKACTMPEGGALGFFETIAIGGKTCLADRIGYIYPEGIKIREPWGKGTRPNGKPKSRFAWAVGRPTEPWRYTVAAWRPWITRFIITEGESDALALIHAGLSDFYPTGTARTAVVASPGTSFRPEWARLFAGREVELWFDQDDAGRTAARRIAAMLHPHARSVRILKRWQQ